MLQQAVKAVSVEHIMDALQMGKMAQAAQLCDQRIAVLQTCVDVEQALADAYHLRGMARRELGQWSEALQDMRHAAELEGDNAMLWLHIAQIELRLQALDAATHSLRQATRLQPRLEEAWFHLGGVLLQQQDWSAAREAYAHVLALSQVTTHVQALAHNGLGIALRHLEQMDASIEQFSKALQLEPGMLDARLNLAESYRLQRQSARALKEIQRGLQDHPHAADAYVALSEVLAEDAAIADASAALTALRRALELQPDYRLRFARRLHRLERQLCDWSVFADSVQASLQAAHENAEELGDLFITLSIPGFERSLQHKRAALWAEHLQHEARAQVPAVEPVLRQARERVRIGYLSADFHAHPTAWLMAEIFELHDEQCFEIYAYSLGPDDGSPMRQRLQKAFGIFCDLRGMTLAQIDARIRADQIDILVDLKGYTQDARPEILALRPAPIQVNYLGYPGTMGGDFMDYIIADDIVLLETHRADYSENVAYLPWSYQCNDRQRSVGAPPTRSAAGLPEHGLVLCCFNTTYKLTPEFFAAWCAILRDTPGSVLWLLDGGEHVRAHLTHYAAEQGIEPSRLLFAPKLPHAEHLARLSLADVFLDTLPYNAHTTASDALWVGVPVITCMGDTFAGRVAASLLHAVGLDELVTDSLAAYQALALRLLRDPAALARLKRHLHDVRLQCPLFDSAGFTRDLEKIYEQMWQRHQQGLPPGVLRVEREVEPMASVIPVKKRPWFLRWLG